MNRTVILSTNDNPDYLNYLPYTIWAFNQLGWNTITFYLGDFTKLMEATSNGKIDTEKNIMYPLNKSEEYRDATIVQVSRLFGCMAVDDNRMLMTGDVDLIPLCDYWNPAENNITCWGADLTGRTEFPICYIAMNANKWREIMCISPDSNDVNIELKKLLDSRPNAKSDDFYKWWGVDQQVITDKLNPIDKTNIDREFDGILAKGRADRYDWEGTKNKPSLIDAHMPRPFNLEATKYILQKCFNKLPAWIK